MLDAPASAAPAQGTAYPHLFSPFSKGALKLRNRVVFAAMSTRYAEKGMITQRLIDFHVNRAKGGVSMSITEPLAMLRRQESNHSKVAVQRKENFDLLRKWSDEMEKHGGHILGQIQDPGRGRHEQGRNMSAIGASALPDDISWTVPHVLTTFEVEEIIEEFTASAKVLKDAGWAGVEVSSGHGHIFHQFLARWSNIREDKYGGDIEGRARLLTDLIKSVRSACGNDFIVGVKLPGEDGMPNSIDLDEAERITRVVAATGVPDYLTWCWGTHSDTLYWHLPDLHGPRTPFMDKIKRLGAAANGIPFGSLGLITDPNEGERIVREGFGDLVMMGRPLVTDPAWAIKAQQGREAQIRYCVSCNTCWHIIIAGGQIQCDNNPRVGAPDEADWKPPQAAKKKKIVVVGAGIAGMEAAWVAAARGHDVTVFGAGPEPGGKARIHAMMRGAENQSSIYDYQRLSAERYGAKIEMGVKATAEQILALKPDAVILATGATPTWPRFLPEEYKGEGVFLDVREVTQMLHDYPAKQEGTAVIYDQDHGAMTYNVAELLTERFDRVVIITPRDRIANDEPLANRQEIYDRLYKQGVELVTSCDPLPTSDFENGAITYANVYSGKTGTVDNVMLFTYATPRVPNDELAEPLRNAGVELHLIGDAYAPRFVVTATAEGYKVGNTI